MVAVKEEQTIWICWLIDCENDMIQFTTTSNPIQVVNFFIKNEERWKWIWSQFLKEVELVAKNKWYTEIILNSGPRYTESARWFYDKYFWEKLWTIYDKYWEWLDANVRWKII